MSSGIILRSYLITRMSVHIAFRLEWSHGILFRKLNMSILKSTMNILMHVTCVVSAWAKYYHMIV